MRGRPFGKAVAAASRGLQGSPGDQIFRWLRDWVAEGMFTRVELARIHPLTHVANSVTGKPESGMV